MCGEKCRTQNRSSGRAWFCSASPTCKIRTPIDRCCRHRVVVVPSRSFQLACASLSTGDSDLRAVTGIGLQRACQCISFHVLLRSRTQLPATARQFDFFCCQHRSRYWRG